MSDKGRRTLRPAYRNAIIISVLAVAFVASTLLAIDVAVNSVFQSKTQTDSLTNGSNVYKVKTTASITVISDPREIWSRLTQ
jgi:hypothetical protein